MPCLNFAYASLPHSIPATIKAAIETISKSQQAELVSWETLNVGGKYIVQEICDRIDDCDFFCADITTINPNVMYEVGFAIARDKRVWLIRDDSYVDSKAEFDQLRFLTTVGYRPYTNAEQIIKGFFADNPDITLEDTIFRKSIEPLLAPTDEQEPLLYLKSRIDTEGSVRVSRVLDRLNPKPVLDDPRESSVQPLYWYGQKALPAPGVLAHFLSPQREGSKITNARYALVSGLANGFDRPLLMLSELHELLAPMDYRDQMRYYTTPTEAGRLTEQWLQEISSGLNLTVSAASSHLGAIKLATELRDFHQQLGEYVAENEADRLSNYFVETTAHMDIVNGTQTIFVGRKGTGKTASLIQAEREIGREANNLVCVLKPVGYEMDALARLFDSYKVADHKGYVIESLWKYILYTELALAAAHQIENVTPWLGNDPVNARLLDLLREEEKALSGDFTIRLETVVAKLLTVSADTSAEKFPTRDYLVSRILPRPRDIVYLVKAAVSTAVNRKHDRVEQKDIVDGELQYSQYAWDSILVENNNRIPSLDKVLLEFVGDRSVLLESTVRKFVSSAGIDAEQVDHVIAQLVGLTFLGIEVGPGKFAYADEKKERQKNVALASRFAVAQGLEVRYEVNAPFRSYLELDEADSSPRLL